MIHLNNLTCDVCEATLFEPAAVKLNATAFPDPITTGQLAGWSVLTSPTGKSAVACPACVRLVNLMDRAASRADPFDAFEIGPAAATMEYFLPRSARRGKPQN